MIILNDFNISHKNHFLWVQIRIKVKMIAVRQKVCQFRLSHNKSVATATAIK